MIDATGDIISRSRTRIDAKYFPNHESDHFTVQSQDTGQAASLALEPPA
jgi:hypothetical protein